MLIRRGLLKADARNDVFALRDALYRHFEATVARNRTASAGLAENPLRPLRTLVHKRLTQIY